MKRVEIRFAKTWTKEWKLFTFIPILLWSQDYEEKENTIAFHWLIFALQIARKHKKKLFVTCKRMYVDTFTPNKDYEVIKTNKLSYLLKNNNDEVVEKTKTMFHAPFEK